MERETKARGVPNRRLTEGPPRHEAVGVTFFLYPPL
jgi:hypothetical protein